MSGYYFIADVVHLPHTVTYDYFFMKTISMRIITKYFLLIIILESGKLRAIVGVAVSGKKEYVLFIMNSYLYISLYLSMPLRSRLLQVCLISDGF